MANKKNIYMYILIFLIYTIASAIGFALLAALVVKKEYTVERKIIINQPRQKVFDFLKFLKNQDQYNKWWQADPNAKTEYKGIDGTVGFMAAWDSADKKVGKGEEEIKSIKEGERVDYEIRFEKPFKGIAHAYMKTETEGNEHKSYLGFYGKK
jgi:uncharacterized protein YndB with AHSA1/START domain